MTKEELLHRLTHEPALITREAVEAATAARSFGFFADDEAAGDYQIDDGIATIPIVGVLGYGVRGIPGTTDTRDIAATIDTVIGKGARGIVLDIDSPGGLVAGTPELAEKIAAVETRILAYTSGQMASAAYWIGAAADYLAAARSADVGSIGVYSTFIDMSRLAERIGIKVDVITSGKYKGAGIPGTSLSEAQRAHMQARVDEIADSFQQFVWKHQGGDINKDDMQGQAFTAAQAAKKNLINEVNDSLPAVVSSFLR